MVRETGLEPVRDNPHAPQTCASASSATLAYVAVLLTTAIIIHDFDSFVKRFLKNFLRLSKIAKCTAGLDFIAQM